MASKWYDKSAFQTASLLGTDVNTGLNRDEVKKRRRLDGENDIYPTPKKNYKTYLAHLLTDYNSILMLTVLIIAAIFEETENLYVMLSVLLTYYIIAMAAYMKSHSVLDDMGKGALPNVKVLRAGKLFMIKQRQLVKGDIIYVSAGDIIPCDARLCESSELEVLEVNVTGVAHAVRKSARFEEYHDIAPAEQKNMLFASSIVTMGNGKAICCEVGKDTLVSVMKKNQPIVSHEKLKIFDKIAIFCRRWTLFMTLTVMALTLLTVFFGKSESGLFGAFISGVSLAVSSMSEFYTAFGFIVLACGIFGALNRKNELNRGALIKNSAKLDDIKDLTCLIVPKEGAFSIRGMQVQKIYANGDTYEKSERGYKKNAARLIRYALISTGKYGAGRLTSNNTSGQNIYTPEEDAILRAAEYLSEYNIGLEKRYPLISHLDRSARGILDTSLVRYENGYFISVRGDYTEILNRCSYYTEDSRVYNMTEDKLNEIYIEAEKLVRQSYRVIAVASKDVTVDNLRRVGNSYDDLTLEGLLAIKEAVLPEAAKNVLRFKNASCKVIMLADDMSENNYVVAESLGIVSSPENVINGRELSLTKEGLIRINLDKYALYQGLNLAQKRLIVRFLQESGEKVGYLCSSLDEIILMKDADVGFAQSITLSDRAGGSGVDLSRHNIPIYSKDAGSNSRGCEALKFVSDVVVSEPDESGTGGFNAIIDAILCAKSVYANLHRMLKYMISSQLSRLLLVFISVFLDFNALIPPQILFSGLMVDLAAIIIIAFEKPDPLLLKEHKSVSKKLEHPFLYNPEASLFGILLAVIVSLGGAILLKQSVLTQANIGTYCFVSFVFAQIALLNECKRESSSFDKNIKVNGAFLSMIAMLSIFLVCGFVFPSFGELFGICKISSKAFVMTFIPAAVITLVYEFFKIITVQESNSK